MERAIFLGAACIGERSTADKKQKEMEGNIENVTMSCLSCLWFISKSTTDFHFFCLKQFWSWSTLVH